MEKKRISKFSITEESYAIKNNFVIAIIILVICSLICSLSVVYICDYVLDSFSNSNAMVGLITDSGLIFDDKNLESNISNATFGLKAARDFGSALSIGLIGISIVIILRIKKLFN